MTIEPRAPNPPSEPSFPLNVQAGSPQYTLTSQITPASSTTFITVTNTDSIEPISNAYYTIQNEDGSKWCTFYIGQWTKESTTNYYTGACTYSSSNTSDVFPVGSVCWCIWTKEYYDSLTDPICNSIKQIDYDPSTTTFSIVKTNGTTSEINTSPSHKVAGVLYPFNFTVGGFDEYSGISYLRFAYNNGQSVESSSVQDLSIFVPIASTTHHVYFEDIDGTLYITHESNGGIYSLYPRSLPVSVGVGNLSFYIREMDEIVFHVPRDNFGVNYTVTYSAPDFDGFRVYSRKINNPSVSETNLSSSDTLPRVALLSSKYPAHMCSNTLEGYSDLYSPYAVYEFTINITKN